MSLVAFALSAFSAVFSVVDPLGVVPVYLVMTAADGKEHKRRTALRAAGAILLLLLAVDMLRAQPSRQRTTPEEEAEGKEKPDVSVFPLAIPMLSGPGAFATVMMLMTRAHTVLERGMVFLMIAA